MNSRLLACLAAALAFALPAHAADTKPAATPDKPAASAPKPVPGTEPDPKIFQDMFSCLAPGLVPDWKRAWVTVVELDRTDDGKSRNYEAVVRYTTKGPEDIEGEPLNNCGAERILGGVADLNDYLKPEQRAWTEVTIMFYAEGKYEAKYGYTPVRKPAAKPAAEKPAATKPGAKPAAKPAAGDSKAGFKLGQ